MTHADTPMPGEDPGALIEGPSRVDEIEPSPKREPTVPEEKETEIYPTFISFAFYNNCRRYRILRSS
jgi:hypothetical protein